MLPAVPELRLSETDSYDATRLRSLVHGSCHFSIRIGDGGKYPVTWSAAY
jgi:hypothetical protein